MNNESNPAAQGGTGEGAELPPLPVHEPFSNIGEALAWHVSQRERQLREALTDRDTWRDTVMNMSATEARLLAEGEQKDVKLREYSALVDAEDKNIVGLQTLLQFERERAEAAEGERDRLREALKRLETENAELRRRDDYVAGCLV